MKISEIDVWIHASSLHKLMTGNFGLSEKQSQKLKTYIERDNGNGKPLTDRMKEEMARLKDAKENPYIGETGRSYIREFITGISRGRFHQANGTWKRVGASFY